MIERTEQDTARFSADMVRIGRRNHAQQAKKAIEEVKKLRMTFLKLAADAHCVDDPDADDDYSYAADALRELHSKLSHRA